MHGIKGNGLIFFLHFSWITSRDSTIVPSWMILWWDSILSYLYIFHLSSSAANLIPRWKRRPQSSWIQRFSSHSGEHASRTFPRCNLACFFYPQLVPVFVFPTGYSFPPRYDVQHVQGISRRVPGQGNFHIFFTVIGSPESFSHLPGDECVSDN